MSSRLFLANPNPNWVLFLSFTISASSVLLLAFLIFLFYLLYSLIRKSRTSSINPTTPSKLNKFSYKDLKHATNSFNAVNLIGKGGSGTVFRGLLPDGKSIAVKKLDASSLQVEIEFQNELQILGGLQSHFVVSLLGYCVRKNWRFLVYEFMSNGSLQGLLFRERSSMLDLNWERRYEIILDVAQALEFLHLECVPPVIHGDIKPGNVLLGSDYRAKISDFGLSRVKIEGEYGIDMTSQELSLSSEIQKDQDPYGSSANINGITLENSTTEVNSNLSLQVSSMKKSGTEYNLGTSNLNSSIPIVVDDSRASKLNGNEIFSSSISGGNCMKSISHDSELRSTDNTKELNSINSLIGDPITKTWSKDGSDESGSKDYVMDWISSQISPRRNSHGHEANDNNPKQPDVNTCTPLDKSVNTNCSMSEEFKKSPKKKVAESGIECCKGKQLEVIGGKDKLTKLKAMKKRFSFKTPQSSMDLRFQFQQGCLSFKRSQSNSRNGWKNMRTHSFSSQMWSGEFSSRELSSSTSMRGTVCYVAPEYHVTEKSDIYSLGVLILVIISGRRPLHVLSSPMKLKKANLISWCRLLAQDENVLELVDARFKDVYNKEQARLCINLALLCLQKTPELRPGIGDIVRILKREMDLPALPLDLGPSSTSKRFSRSRRIVTDLE